MSKVRCDGVTVAVFHRGSGRRLADALGASSELRGQVDWPAVRGVDGRTPLRRGGAVPP